MESLPIKFYETEINSSSTELGRVCSNTKNIGGITFFVDRYKGGDRINIRTHGA